MNNNGQATIEAMLVLAAVLALFAVFIQVFQETAGKSGVAEEKSGAIAAAKKCAAVIDAVFANSGGKPKTVLENCVPTAPHQIQVNGFLFEKTAFTIAEKMELVQYGEQTALEVTTPDHYQ